ELLEAIAEGPVPDELRDVLLDRSGGNPFFLEELLSLLAEAPARDDDTRLPVGVSRELPHTLRGLVAARLDALSTEERCILEDAAVLGRRGAVGALEIMGQEAHDLDGGVISSSVAGLVLKDLLVVDDGRWSFRSDLVREVAYGMMTKADRARRHYGVAKWMESHNVSGPADVDRTAHHFATAAGLVDELLPVVVKLSTHGLELRHAQRAQVERFLLARARARINMRDLAAAAVDVDA